MLNQTNATKRSEDGIKQRKIAKTGKKQQKPAKGSREEQCTANLQEGTAVHWWSKPRTASMARRTAVRLIVGGGARPSTAVRWAQLP